MKNIPDNLKQKYHHIDWRSMERMRDKLIHNYFGIDYEIVWDVVINEIPKLQGEIRQILENESEN